MKLSKAEQRARLVSQSRANLKVVAADLNIAANFSEPDNMIEATLRSIAHRAAALRWDLESLAPLFPVREPKPEAKPAPKKFEPTPPPYNAIGSNPPGVQPVWPFKAGDVITARENTSGGLTPGRQYMVESIRDFSYMSNPLVYIYADGGLLGAYAYRFVGGPKERE